MQTVFVTFAVENLDCNLHLAQKIYIASDQGKRSKSTIILGTVSVKTNISLIQHGQRVKHKHKNVNHNIY